MTTPGVSLTAACFANNLFEDASGSKCISNLLAAGFRRLVVDIYWDYPRQTWSFCPVQIPLNTAGDVVMTSSISVSSAAGNVSLSNAFNGTAGADNAFRLLARQTSATLTSFALKTSAGVFPSSASTLLSTTAPTPSPTLPPIPTTETIITLGSFQCSPSFTLTTLFSVLSGYAIDTDNTLGGVLNYITFNVHAATSNKAPAMAAPIPPAAALPNTNQTIGNIASTNLSALLYTPAELQTQRQNVNSTWLRRSIFPGPSTGYYVFENTSQGLVSVPDGWPSTYYLLYNARRLLLELGTIDPQMTNYTLAATDNYIFPPNTLRHDISVEQNGDGTVTEGCLYMADDVGIDAMNSSWASTTVNSNVVNALQALPSSINQTLPLISNLTACGLSPFLNTTIDTNTTATTSPTAYELFVESSIWSWAPGQPVSYPNNTEVRCAGLLYNSSARWTVLDCQDRYPAACRAIGSPYLWRVPSSRGRYEQVNDNCPDGYNFAVPRTALENRHLLAVARAQAAVGEFDGSPIVWVNLNSLDVQDCWVTGVNATCPYSGAVRDPNRVITVPAVAAVIVLVVALLTLILKINSNRQISRRKRVGDDGWDYEGVPS